MKRSSARQKGDLGEREVLGALQAVATEEYARVNLPPPELTQGEHGRDIIGLPWLAAEVKRVERQNDARIGYWWDQCKAQARADQEAILFFRKNRSPWRVKMFVRLQVPSSELFIKTPGEVSWEAALLYIRHRIRCALSNRVVAG